MKVFKSKFCKVVFCAMLGAASIGGAPLRPGEVDELMHAMNVPKVAHTLPDDADEADPFKTSAGAGPLRYSRGRE